MFAQPQTVMIFALIGIVVYWLLPPTLTIIRAWWLIILSCALIAYVSIYAVIAMIAVSVWTYAFEYVISKIKAKAIQEKYLGGASKVLILRAAFWLAIAGLTFPLVLIDLSQSFVAVLGLSYVAIKSLGVILDASGGRDRAGLTNILLLNSFFPIFASGPIEGRERFVPAELSKAALSANDFFVGLYRFLEGIFITYFIGQAILFSWLIRYTNEEYVNAGVVGVDVIAVIFMKFLYLYANFTGYTSIAIGISRLFGIKVSENFNYPLLARSPQEFWQRWHISLGNFLNKYLYFRFVVALRRPQVSLMLAFVIVGFWHHVSILYFIWGLGHGGALVLYTYVKRKYTATYTSLSAAMRFMIGVCGTCLTLFWVAVLSFVANAPSASALVDILRRIVLW